MINENNRHSWCVNAFHAMSGNNDGSTKICCMVKETHNELLKRDDLYLGQTSIKENFENEAVIKIRNNLENGVRDTACNLCWQEEDGGRKSKRIRDNDRYLHEMKWEGKSPFQGLAKFELNLGNTCNIKCRTCHATISSQWIKEEYDLNRSHNMTFKVFSESMKKYHKTYDEDSKFWSDLVDNLNTIKQFDFYGGEPFLSKKMWEVLKICVDRNFSQEIELHYNTNGTTWPEEIVYWKNFKSINLSFSIDGIDEQFEYMRFLAKWSEVKENMEKARQFKKDHGKISLSWCVTLSSINIYYLPEILDEYYKNYSDFGLYLNLVHTPLHFNIANLHPAVKNKVIEKLESIPKEYSSAWAQLPGIVGFIKNGNYNSSIWLDFIHLIKKHDIYRKEDFYSVFSEFGKIVNDSVLE